MEVTRGKMTHRKRDILKTRAEKKKAAEGNWHTANASTERPAKNLQTDHIAMSPEIIEQVANDPTFMEQCNKAIHPDTGMLSEYHDLAQSSEGARWQEAYCKEVHHLAGGTPEEPGTNTIQFIPLSEVPKGESVTYCRTVADYRPQKADPYRIRLTAGGNLIDVEWDVGTHTADTQTAKTLLNSVLSTKNAKFVSYDVKNFYLNTTLPKARYMHM